METQYKVVDRSELDVMLNHTGKKSEIEIQDLQFGLKRVSAIGDGNCLLHSFLYSTNPQYRTANKIQRQALADNFRLELTTHIDKLHEDADAYYADVGGSIVAQESFADLREDRVELGIEFAPLIGRHYGYNVLAVRLDGTGTLRPVRLTGRNFDETLPTVILHYVGGGLDFAQDEFMADGHYEPVVYSEAVARSSESGKSKSQTRKKGKGRTKAKVKAKKTLTLSEETMYIFPPGAPQLVPILTLFHTPSEGANAYTAEAAEAEAKAKAKKSQSK